MERAHPIVYVQNSMLLLHGGWQRTGTSSLQAALAGHAEHLAAAGVIYPDRWRAGGGEAHHGIVQLLESPSATAPGMVEFQDYLRVHSDRTVLVSTEALNNWLSAERRPALLRVLAAAREAGPVTLFWTLRRVDDQLTSLYLHRVVTDRSLPSPADFFAGFRERGFAGAAATMRAAERLSGIEALYGRYEGAGAHHKVLLRGAGVPARLRDEIVATPAARRLNVRIGRKAAIVLLHTPVVEERIGRSLPRDALRRALRSGELRFAGDAPCELVAPELRREVHMAALRASREAGFTPYAEFFGADEIPSTPATPLDPAILTDADLSRLRSWLACEEAER
jgi:hypothetical protein